MRLRAPAPEDCMDFLSFTFQGNIKLEIDGVFYETERHAGFFRAHFPAPACVTEIKIETDCAVVSDLRTWKEESPCDIISNLIEEMQPLLPRIPCGELAAEAEGKHAVLLSDVGFVENNLVICFNGEVHQIRNINENKIEFYSAFDGEKIISDLYSSFSIVLLVKMGYYDRESTLPSVPCGMIRRSLIEKTLNWRCGGLRSGPPCIRKKAGAITRGTSPLRLSREARNCCRP
jgi:hypothetical protein